MVKYNILNHIFELITRIGFCLKRMNLYQKDNSNYNIPFI